VLKSLQSFFIKKNVIFELIIISISILLIICKDLINGDAMLRKSWYLQCGLPSSAHQINQSIQKKIKTRRNLQTQPIILKKILEHQINPKSFAKKSMFRTLKVIRSQGLPVPDGIFPTAFVPMTST
jgi:hypothetical protein